MRYYLIAGEASGDLHGSNLMRGLYARDPEADIRFWGGGLIFSYRAAQAWKASFRSSRSVDSICLSKP